MPPYIPPASPPAAALVSPADAALGFRISAEGLRVSAHPLYYWGVSCPRRLAASTKPRAGPWSTNGFAPGSARDSSVPHQEHASVHPNGLLHYLLGL